MNIEYTLNPRQTALFLGFLAFCLALQSVGGEFITSTWINGETHPLAVAIFDLFSVNTEESIPTWYSTFLLLLASLLLAFITHQKKETAAPYFKHWAGLALLFLFLSLDEGAVIHEIFADPMQENFQTTGFFAFGWQLAYLPWVIVVGLAYVPFVLKLPADTAKLFIAAGLLYIGGAVVIEGISANEWEAAGGNPIFRYLAIATVEELCEMWGVVLFIYALLRYATQQGYSLTAYFSPVAQPFKAQKLAAGVLALLFLLNVAAGAWAWGQRGEMVEVDPRSVPFYQTVSTLYEGQGVVILGLNEVLQEGNPAAVPLASSLLTLFDEVLVVVLPQQQISIAFAGPRLPFDQARLAELIIESGEMEFVILATAELQVVANPPSE